MSCFEVEILGSKVAFLLATIIDKKVAKTDSSFLAIFGTFVSIIAHLLIVVVFDLA